MNNEIKDWLRIHYPEMENNERFIVDVIEFFGESKYTRDYEKEIKDLEDTKSSLENDMEYITDEKDESLELSEKLINIIDNVVDNIDDFDKKEIVRQLEY